MTHFPPFIRQIQDYFRFSSSGNVYLQAVLEFTGKEKKFIENEVYRLLDTWPILKSRFTYHQQEGFLFRYESDALPQIREFHSHDGILELEGDLAKHALDDEPLVHFALLVEGNSSFLYTFVNHIIADGPSMEVIHHALSTTATHTSPPLVRNFQATADKMNLSLFRKQKRTFHYFSDKLNLPLLKNFDIEKIASLSVEDKFLYLSNSKYYSHSSSIAEDDKRFINFAEGIPNAERLHALQSQHGLPVQTLVLAAYLNTLCKMGITSKPLIGLLFNARKLLPPPLIVGELTGETFFCLPQDAISCFEQMKNLQEQLILAFRHLIFNYNFYGIDEHALYTNKCHGFFNFSKSEQQFSEFNVQLQTFGPSVDLVFDLDPLFVLYQDGTLLVSWRFNKSVYSKETLFVLEKTFRQELRTLTEL